MKFVLLISLKLLTIANSVLLNIAEHEISLLINMKMSTFAGIFQFYQQRKFLAQLSMKNYNLEARTGSMKKVLQLRGPDWPFEYCFFYMYKARHIKSKLNVLLA